MTTKNKLMAVAFACAVIPAANAANITGDDGNPATDLTVDAPNTTVTGNAEVNGEFTVQPAPPVGPGTATNDALGQVDPDIADSGNPNTSVVQTTLGSVEGDYDDVTGGGVLLQPNGNATLSSSAGNNIDVLARRVTRFQVFNADQPLAGQPVPGTQQYYLTDGSSNILTLTTTQGGITPNPDGGFNSVADLDAWVAAAPLDDPGYAGVSTATALPDSGGNLQVGGNGNVDGVLSLGDTGSGAVADVAAAINGNTAGIATNASDIVTGDAATLASANTYTDNSVAAEAVLRQQGDAATLASANTYTDNSVAAEAVLRQQGDAATLASANTYTDQEVATERNRAIAAENVLSGRITTETNNRIAADNILQNQINTNAGAIASNRSRIDKNSSDIQTNTRGIAMVAAMTNTTVLPGNTQAIDFNLSHFEGETGFGFGYARAINPNLQLKFAVASTTDFDESVVRAGVSYQW